MDRFTVKERAYLSNDGIISRNYFRNMEGMNFPSQIIVYKDSQELGCVYLFNMFIIKSYFEIGHWFIILFFYLFSRIIKSILSILNESLLSLNHLDIPLIQYLLVFPIGQNLHEKKEYFYRQQK